MHFVPQETEEALEELRSKYRDTKGRMDAEVESLASQVTVLTTAIEAVQVRHKSKVFLCLFVLQTCISQVEEWGAQKGRQALN